MDYLARARAALAKVPMEERAYAIGVMSGAYWWQAKQAGMQGGVVPSLSRARCGQGTPKTEGVRREASWCEAWFEALPTTARCNGHFVVRS